MQIVDSLNAPWAIRRDKLKEIIAVYGRHAHGEAVDLQAIEAALGKKLDNQPQGYTVQDGVAVLPIEGVISKRMNLMNRISGGVSTQLFQSDLQAALDDPNVHSIVLLIDSPGGAVDGTQAAAQAVRAARDQKPVVVLADGMIASAAYWIGSGAEQIFITGDTTEVGSIGVVAAHVDWSQYEQKAGYKVTEITAGKFKRIASEHAPLTPEGFTSIKDQLDHIYTVFVSEVAANRGTDVDTVLNDMADGRIFMGQKAIAAGLADGISSLPAVIAMLNERAAQTNNAGAIAPQTKGAANMAMETVTIAGAACKTQAEVDAAVATAIANAQQEGKSAAEAGNETKLAEAKAAAKAEGATAERERILAVEANAMPGHEKLIAEMKADGKTSGPEAAQRVLAAEKAKLGQVNNDLHTDAPKAAPASEGTQEGTQAKETDPTKLAEAAQQYQAEQAKAGRQISMTQAMDHVMAQQPQK